MIKATGIVRRVDELGRFVIPSELRRTLGIELRDPLEVFVQNDEIVLRKYQPLCIFCGSSDRVTPFQGKNVCGQCRAALNREEATRSGTPA